VYQGEKLANVAMPVCHGSFSAEGSEKQNIAYPKPGASGI
jgi:hypothetical protein